MIQIKMDFGVNSKINGAVTGHAIFTLNLLMTMSMACGVNGWCHTSEANMPRKAEMWQCASHLVCPPDPVLVIWMSSFVDEDTEVAQVKACLLGSGRERWYGIVPAGTWPGRS